MRIAVLTSSYPRFPGDGAAPFVKSIAEQMKRQGHEVEVVAPYDPAIKNSKSQDFELVRVHRFRYIWPEKLHIMGHAQAMQSDVRLRPLSIFLLPFFLFFAFCTLSNVTRQQKTQVIHVHWVLPNGPVGALAAIVRKIPFIISLHGSDIFMAQSNRIFGMVAKWVFKRAAIVTACSPELRNAALELGAREVRLLAWGADPQTFNPANRSRSYRHAAGWTDDTIIVNALGRLVHKKGFDRLVAAWVRIAARHPNAHLVIGGSGPQSAELQDQINHLDLQTRVSLQGQVPWNRVPEFLASGDVFVLPSVRDPKGNMDGLPTVLLEAMGSGEAIVASHLAGIPLVVQDGLNGLLVPPDNVPALEEALEAVMDTTRRRTLSLAARHSVEDIYNWENVVRELGKIMDSAVISHN